MAIGLGIGIPFRRGGSSRPCTDNLIFEGSEFVGGLYLDKDRLRANDAKLINSNCLRFNGIDNDIVLPHIPELDDARNPFHFIYETSNFNKLSFTTIFSQRENSNRGIHALFTGGNVLQMKITNSSDNQILIGFDILVVNEKLEILYDGSMNADGVSVKVDDVLITNKSITNNNLTNFDISNAGVFTINSMRLSASSTAQSYFLNSCANRIFLSANNIPIFDFSCSEGNNNKAYNRVDDSAHQINGTLTDIWSEKQDLVHNNIVNGFDLWKNDTTDELLRVPYNINNQSIKGENDTITGYTWQSTHPANSKVHNYAETQIKFLDNDVNFNIPNPASTENIFFKSSTSNRFVNTNIDVRKNLKLADVTYLNTNYNSNAENASTSNLNFVIDFKNFIGDNFKYLVDSSDGNAGFFIRHNNNILSLSIFTTGGTSGREVHLAIDSYTSIAFQIRGSKLRYFVNKFFAWELDITGDLINPNASDIIGAEFNGGNGTSFELLGVARCNELLTDEQFQQFLNFDESLNYAYRFKCDEGTGTSITDYSTRAVDGSVSGGSHLWVDNSNNATIAGSIITFPKNSIINSYEIGSENQLLNKAFFRKTENSEEEEYGIYEKFKFFGMGYVTSNIYMYDQHWNLIGQKNLYNEVNSQGQIEYSDTIGGRSICTNADRTLFFVPTNKTFSKIYIFDSQLNWTGCYVDINNMSSKSESIYIGNNGNIFVSANTERNVYEYTYEIVEGWNIEVGTFVQVRDLSAIIPSQITGIVQDRVTDNWYLISNTTDQIFTLDNTFSLVSSTSIATRIGGLFTNFQALEKVGEIFLLSNVNYDAFLTLDSNFKLIDFKYQTEDVSMIGIACASVGLEGTELEKTLNYYNYNQLSFDKTLLSAWHPGNLSGLEGSQLFYNIDDKNNTKNHLIYSQPINGVCLDKTKKYTKWK